MKTTIALLLSFVLSGVALSGPNEIVLEKSTAPATTLFRAGEIDIGLAGTGAWTQSDFKTDRYFGVDHTLGGTLSAKYFFSEYLGLGIDLSGYDVRNLSTPARAATSTDKRRFVGDALVSGTFRYPLGTSAFAPYVRIGAGGIGNGGNKSLIEPTGTIGKKLKFEIVEHDVKMLAEGAVGVEYRLNQTFGIFTEAAFDKIDRPQSNFTTFRTGVNVAF